MKATQNVKPTKMKDNIVRPWSGGVVHKPDRLILNM